LIFVLVVVGIVVIVKAFLCLSDLLSNNPQPVCTVEEPAILRARSPLSSVFILSGQGPLAKPRETGISGKEGGVPPHAHRESFLAISC
jgi:hypothetical protein